MASSFLFRDIFIVLGIFLFSTAFGVFEGLLENLFWLQGMLLSCG